MVRTHDDILTKREYLRDRDVFISFRWADYTDMLPTKYSNKRKKQSTKTEYANLRR